MTTSAGSEVSVVHCIPGRMRVRVPALQFHPELADRIRRNGARHPGVRQVRVDCACASVVVEGDPGVLSEKLVSGWLSAPPPVHSQPADPPTVLAVSHHSPPAGITRRLLPLGFSLGGAALTFVGAWAYPLALGLTALGTLPIIRRGLSALAGERRLTVDHLDSVAVGIMASLGDLRGAGLMCALVALGEEIRERTARRSQRAALDLQSALGQSAWVIRGREKVRVPVDQLRVHDLVAVYPGDLIPVDGVVVDGTASADEKLLTGESTPVHKSPGERVLAGTVVADGRLHIQAEAVGDMTRAGRIVRLLEEAPEIDSRTARYAEHFANRLVAPTFALAGVSLVITGNPAHAAAILIVDFATGIRVSAPTSVMSTLARAARDGVLIKSGRTLEKLAAVDAIVFDKTGTLTRGAPEATEVVSLDNCFSSEAVLALAASAELRLAHPAARAIVAFAERRRVKLLPRDDLQYTPGLGVLARIAGHRVEVGSARYLATAGLPVNRLNGAVSRFRARGCSLVYVGIDAALAGLLAYHDPVREESAAVVNQLRARGIREILIVTGDEPSVAHAVAREVGIRQVCASAMPDDKAAIVRALQRKGRVVAVVGDGINDSPALAHADVSVSLPHGADVARETADVLLMESNLSGLVHAIDLARQCTGLIRENLYVVGVPNAAALALAAAGGLSPVGSTLLSNGSTVVAALNSLRPLLRSDDRDGHAATAIARAG